LLFYGCKRFGPTIRDIIRDAYPEVELLLVVRLPMQLLEHHGDRNGDGRNIRGLS
jgi:hypothetical protein